MRNVVEFADQGGAANVSPILATFTLLGSANMTDLHLTSAEVELKHRGAWGEMIACSWLLQQGYEVFRNISHHGPVDIIAMKDGEITKFDVKSLDKNYASVLRATDEQQSLGVKFLVVLNEGKVFILDSPPPRVIKPKTCARCSASFVPDQKRSIYCSDQCRGYQLRPEGTVRTCSHCGSTFVGRPQAIYCDRSCGNAAAKVRRGCRKRVEGNEISGGGFPADDGQPVSVSFLSPSRAIP